MEKIVTCRPAHGHNHRVRLGRRWDSTPIRIVVTDNPAPDRVEQDREGRDMVTPSNQYTSQQLAVLAADPHFTITDA